MAFGFDEQGNIYGNAYIDDTGMVAPIRWRLVEVPEPAACLLLTLVLPVLLKRRR